MWIPLLNLTLKEEGEAASLSFTSDDTALTVQNRTVYAESFMAGLASITSGLIDTNVKGHRVCFRHEKPIYFPEYERVFEGVVHEILFNQPQDEFVFNRCILDKPLSGNLAFHHSLLKQEAYEKLRKIPNNDSLATKAQTFLEKEMDHRSISMEMVAKQFNMSSRSLQRKLKLEGTSFAQLRDRVLKQFATKYLENDQFEIEDISQRLGFSDTSSFYHAFKRWLGCSPGEYRRRCIVGV